MTLSKERLEHLANLETPIAFTKAEIQAMARELLERRERDKQEPVAWRMRYRSVHCIGGWVFSDTYGEPPKGYENEPLYAAPPAPVVPDEMYWQDAPVEGSTRAAAYATGWNDCRAAMLKQQSSIQATDDAVSGAEINQPASNGGQP